jgi:hypothetical protein|tara:strand:- start:559 stop:789 length:231 start_codon:yes stop_codon:yes gene_type:complete
MTKKEFDALCYKQFMMALDNIQEVEPEDYATIEREEFAAVAYRVFSQGVFMGYNLGARQVADMLKEEGVAEEHTIQ